MSDPYTAKAVRQSAHVLGYWLLVAAVLHAILLPVASLTIAKIAAERAVSEMQRELEAMRQEP